MKWTAVLMQNQTTLPDTYVEIDYRLAVQQGDSGKWYAFNSGNMVAHSLKTKEAAMKAAEKSLKEI